MLAAAAASGIVIDMRHFPKGTKTAQDAAHAIGCDVAAIVKSLVFTVDTVPVVALIPGDKRLDPIKLATAVGGSHCERADLETVRRATGYAAGGTPPFGHATDIPVFGDPTVKRFDPVWVAGGTPSTVFPLSYGSLCVLSGATWVDLVQ